MLSIAATFTKNSGDPATGLALADIAIYLRSRTKAAGVIAPVWVGVNPTEEVGGGIYTKTYAADDQTTYEYYAWAVYSGLEVLDSNYALMYGTGVDQQDVAAASVAVAVSSTTALSVAAGTLAIRTHHTMSQQVTSTTTSALNTATKLWLGIKVEADDADAGSVVFIEKTAGLTYLAGAAYTTVAHGTLVVGGSSGAWTITIGIDEVATALLTAYDGMSLPSEIKALVAGNTVAVWDGDCTVTWGIVRTLT